MSTQASVPYLLHRIIARAGLGVWRHRGSVLLAALLSVALGGYVALTWSGDGPTSLAAGASLGANGDCADAAMAAIADSRRPPLSARIDAWRPSFSSG